MRWCSSKHQPVTGRNLDSFAYCYVASLALPDLLIPVIATTQVHLPTCASPVSVIEFTTTTWGHSPTLAYIIPVPAYRLPTPTSSPLWLRSYYMPIYLPILLLLLASCESSRVAQSCFYVASWHQHAFLLRPPPSYPVSLAHTLNKGRSTTHCETVEFRCSM